MEEDALGDDDKVRWKLHRYDLIRYDVCFLFDTGKQYLPEG